MQNPCYFLLLLGIFPSLCLFQITSILEAKKRLILTKTKTLLVDVTDHLQFLTFFMNKKLFIQVEDLLS